MIDQQSTYDVLVIGSGLGGLVSAVILAKEGKRICVIEKNNQYGGNLQTFSRDKKIFDTGVHYIGGLSKGQNLYRYFSYLGIMKDLAVERMPEVFDKIYFEHTNAYYPVAQGYEAFVRCLSVCFTDQIPALEQYVNDLKSTCAAFPLYNLENGEGYAKQVMNISVKEYFQKLTDDPLLQAVLVGTNFLYAGQDDRTPFYIHALTVNSYIQSAFRCDKGGSQIAKLLIKELRKHGGVAYKRERVTNIHVEDCQVKSVMTEHGRRLSADLVISNIDPKGTLNLVGRTHFRSVYFNRIQELEVTTSAFSLHVVLLPQRIRYIEHNLYGHKDIQTIWTAADYQQGEWPAMFMVSMTEDPQNPGYADTLTILTYMHFKEVEPWCSTNNTVVHKDERGAQYQMFKNQKAKVLLRAVTKHIPGLLDAVQSSYVSTPLTYRDYIGMHRGNLYGHTKDVSDPLRTFIPAKTKINNLYFVGHGTAMHGILGVTIGAVATCGQILGTDYLLQRIKEEADV